jgi:hypothetical protein
MVGMMQKTEVSISGGGVPWQIWLLVVLLAILVIGLIVWLFRGVRKTIRADDEWHYDDYSLMKAEQREQAHGVDASSGALAEPPLVGEPASKPELEVAEPAPIEPVLVEPPPPPRRAPTPPAEPVPPPVKRPAPTSDSQAVAPVEPAQPAARVTQPVAVPEKPLEGTEEGGGEAVLSQPGSDESFFQSFEYEVQQERRRRTARLITGSVMVVLVAVYLLVFPVQDAVNSAVASLGQRLSQLFKSQPPAPTPLATLPQLDIVQEVTTRASGVIIAGRVRNLSSDTLSHLFAEIALVPVGVDLTETRLVPIQPQVLAPNQEGTYRLQISGSEFSKHQLARILTTDQKEITFKLSLAFSPNPARQP